MRAGRQLVQYRDRLEECVKSRSQVGQTANAVRLTVPCSRPAQLLLRKHRRKLSYRRRKRRLTDGRSAFHPERNVLLLMFQLQRPQHLLQLTPSRDQ